ncbi:N-acetylmuramoyl-L-alanine amidase [Terrimonas alba]|uniref:N-acetylmuramoyl-L-alanine amidase n=1 Tax=Terrimonas alba TaxID=3349636 RepID=UPI0035F27F28
MKKLVASFLCLTSVGLYAQNPNKAFIRLLDPARENNAVRSPKHFVSGATCKNCSLTINNEPVHVYPTGAFAYELNMKPGVNVFTLSASGADRSTAVKKLTYTYTVPVPDTVKELSIADIKIFPEGNLVLKPGDRVQLRVKALPKCVVIANGNIPLYEIPVNSSNTMPGIYQAEYTIQPADSFWLTRVPFTITDINGNSITRRADSKLSVLNTTDPDMLITKGRLAHLLFGIGDDRLGGAKIGYIDSLIPLRMTGKIGSLYRVQLSKYRSAYIPDDVVELLPKGAFTPSSLTTNFRVFGDSAFDYVQVGMFVRLPYQSAQHIDPSKIVVDIFGATNNTNWITQLENTKEIKNVYYEQLEDEVLRVTIELKHKQHWGYEVYYSGTRLVIKIRRQPESLELRHLRIAIDAGHGGSNTGASGPTGSIEKELTLAVALKLRQALRLQGAKVIMTRTMETFVDNKDRILMYRDSMPDLLVSIHLNSSGDPINVGGTSTYYRYIGFRELSRDIYKRMLELGLPEWGNTGSFNFMLNSPVEYPNALVEILFLSNPAEEMKILDEGFQQQVADKIVLGIKDFLERCKADK